jgi:hypothetical protein
MIKCSCKRTHRHANNVYVKWFTLWILFNNTIIDNISSYNLPKNTLEMAISLMKNEQVWWFLFTVLSLCLESKPLIYVRNKNTNLVTLSFSWQLGLDPSFIFGHYPLWLRIGRTMFAVSLLSVSICSVFLPWLRRGLLQPEQLNNIKHTIFRGIKRRGGGQGGSKLLHQLFREEEKEGVVHRWVQSLISSNASTGD